MPFDRFLNLLGFIRLEHESDERKRQEIHEALNERTVDEQEAMVEEVSAYDDPWTVPGLRPPAWAEADTRI